VGVPIKKVKVLDVYEEWVNQVEIQNRKTVRARELGTRYWDKNGNPVGALPSQSKVVPEGAVINESAIKGYTKPHLGRGYGSSKPMFYSEADINKILQKEFGSGLKSKSLSTIVKNPDYILAPAGRRPFSRLENIKILGDSGYDIKTLQGKSDKYVRTLAREQSKKGTVKRGKYVQRKFLAINELPIDVQATIRERKSAESFKKRGGVVPDLPPGLKAEMRGVALVPSVFSYRWADPFELDHTVEVPEGGKHVPIQRGHPQYTAMLASEHYKKSADQNRIRKGLAPTNVTEQYNFPRNIRSLLAENSEELENFLKTAGSIAGTGQRGFSKPGVLAALGGAGLGATGLAPLLATEEGRERAMKTLGLLGVPQETLFEQIHRAQGQGKWDKQRAERSINFGDIMENVVGQEWMSKNPKTYGILSTAGDLVYDPLNIAFGGLLKAGASGLRKLKNIWGY